MYGGPQRCNYEPVREQGEMGKNNWSEESELWSQDRCLGERPVLVYRC